MNKYGTIEITWLASVIGLFKAWIEHRTIDITWLEIVMIWFPEVMENA